MANDAGARCIPDIGTLLRRCFGTSDAPFSSITVALPPMPPLIGATTTETARTVRIPAPHPVVPPLGAAPV